MSIQKALQLAYTSRQFGSSYFHGNRSADQILGRHLLPVLQRERADLLAREAAQLRGGRSAHAGPFTFATLTRQLAGVFAALCG